MPGHAAVDGADRIVSPTSLETWATCPFRTCSAACSGCATSPDPRRPRRSARSTRARSSTPSSRTSCSARRPAPTPDQPWDDADPASCSRSPSGALRGRRGAGRHRPVGARGSWRQRRIHQTVERFLRYRPGSRCAASACSPTSPVSSSPSASTAARPCRSPSPTAARSGSAVASTGSTSRPTARPSSSTTTRPARRGPTTAIATGDPVSAGTKLQLPVYTLAAEQHHQVADVAGLLLVHPLRGRGCPRRLPGRPLPRALHRDAHDDRRTALEPAASPPYPASAWIHWLSAGTRSSNCANCAFDRPVPGRPSRRRGTARRATRRSSRSAGSTSRSPRRIRSSPSTTARGTADGIEPDDGRRARGRSTVDQAGATRASARRIPRACSSRPARARARPARSSSASSRSSPPANLELRELAAITFTEAAASELRDRIRTDSKRSPTVAPTRSRRRSEQRRCRAALEQVDEAALTTLHGFAFRILTEHPLEAGLPPGFEVLDDITARIAFEQHWATFVDELFADPALEQVLLTALCSGSASTCSTASPASSTTATTAPAHTGRWAIASRSRSRRRTRSSPRSTTRFAVGRAACRDDDDQLARHVDEARRPPRRARAPPRNISTCSRARPGVSEEAHLPDSVKAGNWRTAGSTTVQGDARPRGGPAGGRPGRAAPGRARGADRSCAVVRVHGSPTNAAATAGSSSTICSCSRTTAPAIRPRRTRPRSRSVTRRLLLDEFQDTDPLQIQIAVLLATTRPRRGRSRSGPSVVIAPGALVVVGDPKQSIYRFRRADLGVYHDAPHELGLEPQSLVQNFRSVPGVLDVREPRVRRAARGVARHPGRARASRGGTRAARRHADGEASVVVFGDSDEDSPIAGRSAGARRPRSPQLVRRIKREGWSVLDPVDGRGAPGALPRHRAADPVAHRAPRRSRTRSNAPTSRCGSRASRWCSRPRRSATCVSILGAIDDPTDEIAVVAALRSSGVRVHRRRPGRVLRRREVVGTTGDPRPTSLAPDHPVVAGLVGDPRDSPPAAGGERSARRSRPSSGSGTCSSSRPPAGAPATTGAASASSSTRPAAWDDAGEAGLRAFVEWVQHQADERARVIESVAPEPDDDALRILTVHGSKGLEFPIVVLAGLNTQPRPSALEGAVGSRAVRSSRRQRSSRARSSRPAATRSSRTPRSVHERGRAAPPAVRRDDPGP